MDTHTLTYIGRAIDKDIQLSSPLCFLFQLTPSFHHFLSKGANASFALSLFFLYNSFPTSGRMSS